MEVYYFFKRHVKVNPVIAQGIKTVQPIPFTVNLVAIVEKETLSKNY